MITKIKALADEAIKLQNKNRMDEVLREISAMCSPKDHIRVMVAEDDIPAGALVVESGKGVKPAKGGKK